MKKLIFTLIFFYASLAMANQSKYEFSQILGYDISAKNLNIKNDGYAVIGLAIQRNIPNLKLSPELSLLYSSGVRYDSGERTNLTRAMLNAIYTFDTIKDFTPFAKVGLGFEKLSNENNSNKNDFFVDAAAGVKIALVHNLALKVEALYMNKHEMLTYTMFRNRTTDNNLIANNFLTLVSLTFAFGGDK